MRIRTIKPEFWQNRELATTSPFSRLLAIALLNWADDDGWFKADLALIRGSLFPFEEDSMLVPRAITELSRIGFIQVADHAGIPLGMIVNFRKHQRIDRPQRSRLAVLGMFGDHSTNTPRVFAAGMEQGTGKGIREGEGEKAPPPSADSPPSASPPESDVAPKLVEDRKLVGKKESAGVESPELLVYLAEAGRHGRGNPDGFEIPAGFVRFWHGMRAARGWERANGVPIPNTLDARWNDLLTMARSEHREGRLLSFMNGNQPSPAQKKKEAAGRMAELLAGPPCAGWQEWARERLGWNVPDDAPWAESEVSARKELWAAWRSEMNKKGIVS